MKRRILSMVMAMVMTISSVPSNAFTVHAHEEVEQEEIEVMSENSVDDVIIDESEEIDDWEQEIETESRFETEDRFPVSDELEILDLEIIEEGVIPLEVQEQAMELYAEELYAEDPEAEDPEAGDLAAPVLPVSISKLSGFKEVHPYGVGVSLDGASAEITYSNDETETLYLYYSGAYDYMLDVELLSKEYYLDDWDLPEGEYTVRFTCRDEYLDETIEIVAFEDYVAEELTDDGISIEASKVNQKACYDFWYTAEESGTWVFDAEGVGNLQCYKDGASCDWEVGSEEGLATVSVVMKKDDRVLLRVWPKEDHDLVLEVEQGKAVSEIILDAPAVTIYGETYRNVTVTLKYVDENEEDCQLTFEDEYRLRDPYGNVVVLNLQEVDGTFGNYTYSATCGMFSATDVTKLISRMEAYKDSKWDNFLENDLEVNFPDSTDYFAEKYYAFTSATSGVYQFTWSGEDRSCLSIIGADECIIDSDWGENEGSLTVTLEENESYLLGLRGKPGTSATVSVQKAKSLIGIEIVEAPAKMNCNNPAAYFRQVKVKLIYENGNGEPEYSKVYSGYDYTDEGLYVDVTLLDESGSWPTSWMPGDVYTVVVTCGDFTDTTVVTAAHAKEFGELLALGTNKLTEHEYGNWYVQFTPETAGAYRFSSVEVDLLLEKEDGYWHGLPQTLYLNAGETAYLEVLQYTAGNLSAMAVTVEQLPDIARIRVANTENLMEGSWTEHIQVIYSYVQSEEGAEAIPDYTGNLFEPSADYDYTASITLTNLETGEVFVPEESWSDAYAYSMAPAGTYSLVITAGGITSKAFTIRIKSWWDTLPEVQIGENVITREQEGRYFSICPDKTVGYCFEAENAYGFLYRSNNYGPEGRSIGNFNGRDTFVLEKGVKYIIEFNQHTYDVEEIAERFTVTVTEVPAVNLNTVTESGIREVYWSGMEYIDPKADMILSYRYADGSTKTIGTYETDQYGYRIGEYGLTDKDGNDVSGDQVLEEDIYDFYYFFAGQQYISKINIQTPELSTFEELENGNIYSLSGSEVLFRTLTVPTTATYEMIASGCSVYITDSSTMNRTMTEYNDCTFSLKPGTYYVCVKNYDDRVHDFSLTRSVSVKNLNVQPGFDSFPEGFAFNPLAGMTITAEIVMTENPDLSEPGVSVPEVSVPEESQPDVSQQSETVERIVMAECEEYIHDKYGRYVSYEMCDSDGNIVNPGNGLKSGSYTVIIRYCGAEAVYPFTVTEKITDCFPATTKALDDNEAISTTGLQYYVFTPQSSRYYLEFSEMMNQWVYDSSGQRIIYSIYDEEAYWNDLKIGEKYYVVFWHSPGRTISSDSAILSMESRIAAEEIEVSYDTEVFFGETQYFRNLKFNVTYSNGEKETYWPQRDNVWKDAYDYTMDYTVLDEEGYRCIGYLQPGIYQAEVRFGDKWWQYELTIKNRETLSTLQEGDNQLTIPAGSDAVYRIPDNSRMIISIKDPSGKYQYAYGDSGMMLSQITKAEQTLWMNRNDWQDDIYLTIRNMDEENSLSVNIEVYTVRMRTPYIVSDVLPSVEPLGWRDFEQCLAQTVIGFTVEGEEEPQYLKLWNTDEDKYYYDTLLYMNGDEIYPWDLMDKLEEGTLRIEFYQTWDGEWEEIAFAVKEIEITASDPEPLQVNNAAAVVNDIAMTAGTLKEYSFTAPVADYYTISFSEEVNYYYKENEEVISGFGTSWSIYLEEGEMLPLAFFTDTATTLESLNIRPSSYCLNLYVSESSMTYTGEPLQPAVTVTFGANGTPVAEEDYEVLYEDNVNVGTASVSIIGKNAYEGLYTSTTFEITPKSVVDDDITVELSWMQMSYNGDKQVPILTVKHGDKLLVEKTDYAINAISGDCVNSGAKEIQFMGMGNYTSIRKVYFEITTLNFEEMKEQIAITDIEDQPYRAGGCTPYPEVKYGDVLLVLGQDYTVSYENNDKPGTATIIFTGIGNYEGTISRTFTITAADLSAASVICEWLWNMTGMDIMPTVKVVLDGTELVAGQDYTVTYDNCLDPGIATATINGQNGYYGSTTVTYEILENIINTSNLTWSDLTEGESQAPEEGHGTVWYRWSPTEDAVYRITRFAETANDIRIYHADEDGSLEQLDGELTAVSMSDMSVLLAADTAAVYYIQLTKDADAVRIECPTVLQQDVSVSQKPLQETAVWKFVPEENGTYQFVSEHPGILEVYAEDLSWIDEISLELMDSQEPDGELTAAYAGNGNFSADIPYYLVWNGDDSTKTLTAEKIADVHKQLEYGDNLVYIPQGTSQTFALPEEAGRYYIGQETGMLSWTYTVADEVLRTETGYSFGYEKEDDETALVTITNLSSKTISTLNLAQVPNLYAAIDFSYVPEKIAEGWAETAASLIFIDCTADWWQIGREQLINQKDLYGYSWRIAYKQNDVNVDAADLEEGNYRIEVYECWGETEILLDSFDSEIVDKDALSELPRGIDLSDERLKEPAMYYYKPLVTGTYQLKFQSEMYAVMQAGEDAVLRTAVEAETTAGEPAYVLIAPEWIGAPETVYTLKRKDMEASFKVSAEDLVFNGMGQTPQIRVYDAISDLELERGVDYTISNQTYTNAQTYQFYVNGYGEYANAVGISSFTVKPMDINRLTFETESYEYTGYPIQFSGRTMIGNYQVSGVDYTIQDMPEDMISIGVKTAVIAGSGNFTGTKNVTYEIVPCSVESAAVEVSGNCTYTGSEVTPDVTVSVNGTELLSGTDYTVRYEENVNAGYATVIITGIGNYTDECEAYFEITPKDISDEDVEAAPIDPQVYDRTEKRPEITVTYGNETLEEQKDYTIFYNNNIAIGTATVDIHGCGNYTGSRTITFTIENEKVPTAVNPETVTVGNVYQAQDVDVWYQFASEDGTLLRIATAGADPQRLKLYGKYAGAVNAERIWQGADTADETSAVWFLGVDAGSTVVLYVPAGLGFTVETGAKLQENETVEIPEGSSTLWRMEIAETGNYRLFADFNKVQTAVIREEELIWLDTVFGYNESFEEEVGSDAPAAARFSFGANLSLEEGDILFLIMRGVNGFCQIKEMPFITSIQVVESSLKNTFNRFDTGFLNDVRFEVTYENETAEILTVGERDSYGRSFNYEIYDEEDYSYRIGDSLEAGVYGRRIYANGEDLNAAPMIDMVEMGNAFTVLPLADSYKNNVLTPDIQKICAGWDENRELNIYPFTAEKDWNYIFESDAPVWIQYYTEDGAGQIAAAKVTSPELELKAGTYYLHISSVSNDQTEISVTPKLRTAPAALESLTALETTNSVTLSWPTAAELDTGYIVYRKNDLTGEFEPVKTIANRATTTWVDTNVEEGIEYTYYVCVTYGPYVKSEPSPEVTRGPGVDYEAPQVLTVTPTSGSRLNGAKTISVRAQDNVAVTRTWIEIQKEDNSWEQLCEAEASACNYQLDTTQYEGVIRLRGMAEDERGNVSSGLIVTYEIDNSGPEQVKDVAVKASTSVTITLEWSDVADEDLGWFAVEQQLEDGSWKQVGRTSTTLGMNLSGLKPGHTYYYRVAAYDQLGNRGMESEVLEASTLSDTTAPVNSSLAPQPGYYRDRIPVTVAGSDDYGIASMTLQISQTEGSWEDVFTWTYDQYEKRRTESYSLDVSQLAEGKIKVRAIVTDTSGNISDTSNQAPYVEYMIDRTAPAAPNLTSVIGRNGYIELNWKQGAEADLAGYNVYRSDTADGTFALLASNQQSLNYFDRTATAGTIWYYYITVSDQAGNTSEASEVLSAEMAADTQKPMIRSIYPADGELMGSGYHMISVLVTDNTELASVQVKYQINESGEYQTLAAAAVNGVQANPTFEIPLEGLEDANTVTVKVSASDAAGNKSSEISQTYTFDLEAPTVSDAQAEFVDDDNAVELTWTGGAESDLLGYRIYRSIAGSDDWKLIIQTAAEAGVTAYTATDWNPAQEAVDYIYRIESLDAVGNTAQAVTDVLALTDRSHPTAVLNCENVMEMGVQYRISALNSSDNTGIASYQIDMGDGTVYRTAEAVHTYAAAGEYTITLTVIDKDNNKDVLLKDVIVKERQQLGYVRVLVQGTDGRPISNAPVYFDLGSADQFIRTTGADGIAEFTAETGIHTVGCVIGNNEYLPQKKDVAVTANTTSDITFTMVKQPIIEGKFEIKRMTLEEIKAAGIDIDDPENQYIVDITVHLEYGTKKFEFPVLFNPITGDTITKPVLIPGGGGGSGRILIPKVIGPGIGGLGGTNTGAEESTALAILDVPVGTSILKEFFDVKLHIINNASSEFSMLDNMINLNVPDGLTIVPTDGTESSASVMIPEIKGGTQTTINWILRGDEIGEYQLSADYSGMLSDFNVPMTARFEAEEPIKVYGMSGMKLTMYIADEIKDQMVYFDLELANEGEIDVYMPDLYSEGSEMVYEEYFVDGKLELNRDATTMKPGEKLVRHYQREATELSEAHKYLNRYWKTVGETYGLTIEIDTKPLSYFRAADDIVTLKFNSQGGTPVADIGGLPKGKTFAGLQGTNGFENLKWPIPAKDGMYFNGWYTTADESGELFTPDSKLTASRTLYASWGKQSSENGSLAAKVGKKEYGLHVVNTSGVPLVGASVTFNGKTKKTDKDGDVVFSKPSKSVVELKISCNGYVEYSDSEYILQEKRYDLVTLYTEKENKYLLKKAVYNEWLPGYANVLKKKKRLIALQDASGLIKDFTFYINCYLGSSDDSDFIRMELWQNNKLIATADKLNDKGCVQFKDLEIKSFASGGGVYVKTIFQLGGEERSVKNNLNMEFVADPKDIEFSIGESITLKVDSGVPLVGGMEFKIKSPVQLPTIKVKSDGTVIVGINIADSELDKDETKEFIDSLTAARKAGGMKLGSKEMKDKIDALRKDNGWQDKEFKWEIIGYFEGQLTNEGTLGQLTGKLVGTAGLSKEFNWQLPITVVPVTAQVEIGVEGEVAGSAGYNFEEDDWNFALDSSVKGEVEGFIGAGLSGIAAAGGYAGGNMKLSMTSLLIPQALDATLGGGMKVYFGPFEYKWNLIEKTFHLWTRTRAMTGQTLYVNPKELYTLEVYEYTDRTYLEEQSDWKGSAVSDSSGTINELLTETYGASKPQIVSAGGTTLMAYIGDTKTSNRSAANMGQLMYSVYKNGSWSAPVPVDQNDRADISFELYTDNDRIYLVYQEAEQVFTDEINKNPENYFKALGVVTAEFDSGQSCFTNIRKASEGQETRYNSQPSAAVNGNRRMTVWVSNESGNCFGLNQTNEIHMRISENGTDGAIRTLANGRNSIVNLTAGVLEGQFAAAYIMDQDNSLDTLDDRTLYLLKEDGTQFEIATGRISNPQFAVIPGETSRSLVWYQDGGIRMQSGFGTAVRTLIDGNSIRVNEAFRIVGNYILYIGTDENGSSNVYALVYKDGRWNEPVFVTNQTQSIYEISAAQIDGEIALVMMQNQQTGDGETQTDHYTMSYMTLAETHNPILTSAEFSYGSIVPGETFDITFHIKNGGTADITSLTAEVTDPDGEVLAQSVYEQTMVSGQTGEFVLGMTAPQSLDDTEYTFRIYETGAEAADKNAMTFQLNETDLSLAAEVTRIGNVYEITAEVTNLSYLASGGTLTVSGSKNKAISSQMRVETLQPSESAVYVIRLDASQFTVQEDVLTLTLESDETDYSSFNNTCIEMIYLVHEVSFYVNGSIHARDYVEEGDILILPEDPESTTAFLGWYDIYNGALLTDDSVVTASAEYEARFADPLYRVTGTNGTILATDQKDLMLQALAGTESVTVTMLTDEDISENLTVAAGNTLVIPKGYAVNIQEGAVLTNNGTIQTDGSLENQGTFENTEILLVNGTFVNQGIFVNTGTVNNNGSFENTDSVENNGIVYNNGTMSNEKGTVTGTGQLVNAGTLKGESNVTCGISNHVHVWAGAATIDTEASCYQMGSRSRHCTVEGCQAKTGIVQIPMTDHTYGDWMVLKEATLATEGTKAHTCAVCGHVETEEIPNLTDAPQKMTGITAEGFTGVYDGTVHSIMLTGIPQEAEVKYFLTENGTALRENPGFVEEGLYTVWYLVTREGYLDVRGSAQVEISECVHVFAEEWETDIEATSEQTGSKSRHCTINGCEAVTDRIVVPMLGSSYSKMQDDLETITPDNAQEEENQAALNDHVDTVINEESASEVIAKVDMDTVAQLEALYLVSLKETDSGENTKASVTDTVTELVDAAQTIDNTAVQAEGAAITAAAAAKDEGAATDDITVQAKLQVKALAYDEVQGSEEIRSMLAEGTAVAYDINLSVVNAEGQVPIKGYEATQPKAPIRITLPIPVELRYAQNLALIHRKESGELETLEYTRNDETNTITFIAEAFSEHYLIPEDAEHAHDYSQLIAEKEMKCGSDGWQKFRCQYCHKTKTVTIPAAAEHTGGEATCESAPICTLCGEVYGEALGHTGGEATCQNKAVCENCGEPYGDLEPCSGGTATCISPAICTMCQQPYGTSTGEHIYSNEWTVDTPAGCLTKGSMSHHCVSDPNCTEKTDVTEIEALDHTGGEADCKNQAVCTRCGTGYGELKEHGGGEATCTEQAICSGCGEAYGELKDHEGGTATCQKQAVCTVCWKPYGEKAEHEFSTSWTTDVEPICTKTGSKSHHCVSDTTCTEKADVTEIEALGHIGGSATCEKLAICTRCGNEHGSLKEHSGGTATCQSPAICTGCGKPYGNKGGHSYETGWTTDHPATCTTAEIRSHHCMVTNCTAKIESTTYGNPLGHTGGSATCTAKAICTRCEQSYGELKAHSGGTATCQSPAICDSCKKPYGSIGNHSYETDWTIDTEPTCTTAGSRSHHCTIAGCTSITGSEPIKALGHTGGEATCTKQAVCIRCGIGYGSLKSHTGGTATCKTGAVCEVCGQNYGSLNPTNHSYGEYVRTKEPTAVEEGIEIRTCTRCGEQDPEERSIEKLEPYIVMSATSIPLQRKKSTTKVKVLEMQTGDSVVSWKSNKTSIAKVSKSGKITAGSKTGTATITVTLESGLKQKIKVTVQKNKVTTKKITGLKKTMSMKKGAKLTLTPIITPITTTDKLTFKSSNKKIVSVTGKGVIQGKKKGKAKITVRSGKKSYTVTITVK